jgi:DNA-binding MarR family transcriptional regulator
MTRQAHLRVVNLLASLSLNLADEAAEALCRTTGLAGSAATALIALHEFLEDSHIGQLADVLGLTHSGAVRLVSQLESAGLARRVTGTDRRKVRVQLTATGRQLAIAGRRAREESLDVAVRGLSDADVDVLERLLAKLVESQVRVRLANRRDGDSTAWWCRACDFNACGRPDGRCPAQATAARHFAQVPDGGPGGQPHQKEQI